MKSKLFAGLKADVLSIKNAAKKQANKAAIKIVENKGEKSVKSFRAITYFLLDNGVTATDLKLIVDAQVDIVKKSQSIETQKAQLKAMSNPSTNATSQSVK